MSLNKSQVTKLVVDLCWEYDRMSSSGQETLDKLCKVLGIETEAEMDALLASMSKEEKEDAWKWFCNDEMQRKTCRVR